MLDDSSTLFSGSQKKFGPARAAPTVRGMTQNLTVMS